MAKKRKTGTGKKATAAEVERRIDELVVWMLDESPTYQDVLRLGATSWKIKARQSDEYLRRAHE